MDRRYRSGHRGCRQAGAGVAECAGPLTNPGAGRHRGTARDAVPGAAQRRLELAAHWCGGWVIASSRPSRASPCGRRGRTPAFGTSISKSGPGMPFCSTSLFYLVKGLMIACGIA